MEFKSKDLDNLVKWLKKEKGFVLAEQKSLHGEDEQTMLLEKEYVNSYLSVKMRQVKANICQQKVPMQTGNLACLEISQNTRSIRYFSGTVRTGERVYHSMTLKCTDVSLVIGKIDQP